MKNPRLIGQYQIIERLATGGAGEVYTGIDTKLGREVAIKFLRPELASDPSFVDRFLVEAKSLARLNHPNIATLYALAHEDDELCMIMELVRGRTVEQVIQQRNGPLPVKECLAIISQAADGLSYAHEQGVIHRDIKPSNLMVADSGRIKIMDFGIARVQGSARLTRAGSAIGTPIYMSPEQHRGLEGDERSDIYSLAVVLYELLAGAPPFKGTADFELAKAHHETHPPPLIPRVPGVENRLESAIMVALSKRPEQRFSSMRAFCDATGATALRGDATSIIQSYVRPGDGRTASHDMQKPPPLHTVALALARSRGASIARRFKGLHPAVQGVSAGVFAAVVIGVLWLAFHTEPGSPSIDTASQSPQSPDSQLGVIRSKAPSFNPNGPASNSVRTLSDTKSQPLQETGCDTSLVNIGEPGCITHDRDDPTKGHVRKPADEKRVPQPEGSNNPEKTSASFASFKAAYDQANYADARTIAEKLYAAGDPAGAYGKGVLYVHGYGGVEEEPARARNLFYEAATAKNALPMAMVKLGVMYHDGKGGEQNKRLARTWFEKAADLGDGEAMFNLGQMSWGNEAGLRHRDAVDLYRKARDAGYDPAKQRLEEIGAGE